MAEAKLYTFKFKELAEILVKSENLHEGHWGIYIEFGIQGTNIGPNESELVPAAIVPVMKIGIQRFDRPSGLTVDASQVNPEGKKK